MFISTFELLVKSQLPSLEKIEDEFTDLPSAIVEVVAKFIPPLSRTIIQGYFLTIANPNEHSVNLSVTYTIKIPEELTIDQFITFFDAAGTTRDVPGGITSVIGSDKYSTGEFTLASRETVLLLLQPNFIRNPDLLFDKNFEARGYAEIFLSESSVSKGGVNMLVTPEHRGTFFKGANKNDMGENNLDDLPTDLGEVAYSLPIQNGGLLRFS